MGIGDEDPSIRLRLAALFHAARLVCGRDTPSPATAVRPRSEDLIRASIADADELLRQVGPK
jgi:hypothetical protein